MLQLMVPRFPIVLILLRMETTVLAMACRPMELQGHSLHMEHSLPMVHSLHMGRSLVTECRRHMVHSQYLQHSLHPQRKLPV